MEMIGKIFENNVYIRPNAANPPAVIDHSTQVGTYARRAPGGVGMNGDDSVGTMMMNRISHMPMLISTDAVTIPAIVRVHGSASMAQGINRPSVTMLQNCSA